MHFTRMFSIADRCVKCGKPFNEHAYAGTDRDGAYHTCPRGSKQLTLEEATELERTLIIDAACQKQQRTVLEGRRESHHYKIAVQFLAINLQSGEDDIEHIRKMFVTSLIAHTFDVASESVVDDVVFEWRKLQRPITIGKPK